jgi:hypothetical protein
MPESEWVVYYLRWVNKVFHLAWPYAAIVSALFAVAIRYGQDHRSSWVPTVNHWAWLIPFWLFLALAVIGIFIAPYILHKEDKARADGATRELENKATSYDAAGEWKKLASNFNAINGASIKTDWDRPPEMTEMWLVCGGDYKRCEALCRLAGATLIRSPRILASLPEDLRLQSDPLYRWLGFLKARGCVEQIRPMEIIGMDENVVGFHLHGSIRNLPAASARISFECAAAEI